MSASPYRWRLRVWTRFLAPVDEVWKVKTDLGPARQEFWPVFDFRVDDPQRLYRAVRQGLAPETFQARLWPWPVRWQTELVEAVPGRYFVDRSHDNALFKAFEHRHLFEPTEDGTRYVDDVRFTPADGLPDRLSARLTARLFAHRHHKAARHLPHDERATGIVVLREILSDEGEQVEVG